MKVMTDRAVQLLHELLVLAGDDYSRLDEAMAIAAHHSGPDGIIMDEILKALVVLEKQAPAGVDVTWEKHKSAEEPGELCWSEVDGIHAYDDLIKIGKLEEEIKGLIHLNEETS
jgi:hypothetical protein